MKICLCRLFIVLMCAALFMGYAATARAQEETPAKIRGNWALPDCKSYDEALIITRHFYLKADKDGSQFWPLSSISKQKDYWIMPVDGQKHPVRVEADGVLKVGLLA